VDSKNNTPLLAAVKTMVKTRPKSPEYNETDSLYQTMSTLISHGADLNVQDAIEGRTILHFLALLPEFGMIDLVVLKGGSLEIKYIHPSTPQL
jgi:hypothetical protein